MIPKTYLSVAPMGMEDMFGHPLSSSEIIHGLRKINHNINLPMPEHYDHWYPLQKLGVSCLWLGEPGKGKKICAFRLGTVPEFTQLSSGGKWMVRGWRSIFEKVIHAGAATQRQIEKQFNIVMESDGTDGSCIACRREGKLRAAEANGKRLCGAHQEAVDISSGSERRKAFIAEAAKRLNSPRHGSSAAKEIAECLYGR